MKLRKVTVQYRFEGEIRQSENERGFLIGKKVLVLPNEKSAEAGLYNAIISDNDDRTVLVDLDADAIDCLQIFNLNFA